MGGIVSKPKAPKPAPAPEPEEKPIQSTIEDRQKAARLRARRVDGRELLSGGFGPGALVGLTLLGNKGKLGEGQ